MASLIMLGYLLGVANLQRGMVCEMQDGCRVIQEYGFSNASDGTAYNG
jgi:hypothetical protein